MSSSSQFSEWRKQLLFRVGCSIPDGRALYEYRLTDDEFSDLEKLLRNCLSSLPHSDSLAHASEIPGFARLFVFYASEWWRRRYDGSGFNWEPILRDIGAHSAGWNPNLRSEIVKQGFRGWRIRLLQTSGMRFIGSVAVQGGLPLQLLATASGNIGRLLSQVLQLASDSQVTQNALYSWVESLADTLPKSYRQDTIYRLLTDVAWTVLQLAHEADLKTSAGAVDILQQKIPRWRDRFPLPVEDEHAKGMIEQLICDAASVHIRKPTALLPVERSLNKIGGCEWELRSSLTLSELLSFEQMMSLFSLDEDDLPRRAQLSLCVGSTESTIDMRKLAGHKKYRLERKPMGNLDNFATGEHLLRLASPNGRVWTVPARRGDELDSDIPWVFIEKDSRFLLARQGSGSVASPRALIAIPENWKFQPNRISEISELGILRDPERRVVEVRGVLQAYDDTGLTFRLSTGRDDVCDETYELVGNRCWLDIQSPQVAFKGLPKLYRIDKEGIKQQEIVGKLDISAIGGFAVSGSVSGPVYFRYPATGDVQYRAKVLVLPNVANVDFIPDDAVSGELRFCNWGIANLQVVTDGVRQNLKVTNKDATLKVAVEENQYAPDVIELEAYWTQSTVPARFRLPFPARGVRVFDANGNSLPKNRLLAIQRLQGVRILISSVQANCHVEMTILNQSRKHLRKFPLYSQSGMSSRGIRLQDYLSDIQQLSSVSDSPDAQVEVQISIQGKVMFTLLLARYSSTLERCGDRVQLDAASFKSQPLVDLDQIPILALRLECPGDEALILEPCKSEGVATGVWLFSPRLRLPGCWLIYPAADSELLFRPTLWFVDGEIGESVGLSGVLSIRDQQIREESINEIIEVLTSDLCHEDWDKVEQLAGQVGHLPLPTLDLWRRFARSPRGMAAMLLRFGTLKPEFIIRFSEELPFAWETIAFEDWQVVMHQLETQCMKLFGEQDALSVLRPHLSERIQLLTSWNGSLAYLLGIAATEWLPDTKKEVEALKSLGRQASSFLLDEKNSLLQRHADDKWPEYLNYEKLSNDLGSLGQPYVYECFQGFRNSTINIPIILSLQVVTGQTVEWFHDAELIHDLRNYHAFDPYWFEEAYNQTIARCFADGLFERQQNEI